MSIEQCPMNRVRRVPVNLPFEDVPSECLLDEAGEAVVSDMASVDIGHGLTFLPSACREALSLIRMAGYDVVKIK